MSLKAIMMNERVLISQDVEINPASVLTPVWIVFTAPPMLVTMTTTTDETNPEPVAHLLLEQEVQKFKSLAQTNSLEKLRLLEI